MALWAVPVPEELLQRMRDIHYPDAPGWFPPAPGWWLLAALLLAALLVLALRLRSQQRRKAPYRQAELLLSQAKQQHEAGQLDVRAYVDECNNVLKRVLVHIRHNRLAVSASGTPWLAELDRIHGGNQFSAGPGKVLGDQRYAPNPPTSAPGLDDLLQDFVRRLQRTKALEQADAASRSHDEVARD